MSAVCHVSTTVRLAVAGWIACVVAIVAVPFAGCTSGELNLLADDVDGGREGGASEASTVDAPSDAPPEACVNGACACGLRACDGGCFDLANDPTSCGECGHHCLHFQYCAAGLCTCLPGFANCNGECSDLASNPAHCGHCTTACDAGESCQGSCGPGPCAGGLTACPADGNRTACADIDAGAPYCGAACAVCGPNQVCAAGACALFVPATPCTACPCDAVCAARVGTPSSCCPGIAGGSQPICVQGARCP